jgi:hypothetical protein
MSDFIFRISSVKLTAEQEQKIAGAIQGAVLAELAQLDVAPPPTPDCLFRPKTWYGGDLGGILEAQGLANTVLGVTAKTAT